MRPVADAEPCHVRPVQKGLLGIAGWRLRRHSRIALRVRSPKETSTRVDVEVGDQGHIDARVHNFDAVEGPPPFLPVVQKSGVPGWFYDCATESRIWREVRIPASAIIGIRERMTSCPQIVRSQGSQQGA